MMDPYEQLYNDLVEKLKEARETRGGYTFKSVIDEFMPGLAESQDERIRKRLIELFGNVKDGDILNIPFVEVKSILGWLEKQGGQKSAEWSKANEEEMPRWKKAPAYENFVGLYDVASGERQFAIVNKGYVIEMKDLEKLPKED